ncbi:MAG: response regulator, partial [Pedobacter sp.]|nr:response regulator [Pedobacter sp.]
PVIAVTAQAMVCDKERCLEAGAVGYVSKPINVDSLTDLLVKYI